MIKMQSEQLIEFLHDRAKNFAVPISVAQEVDGDVPLIFVNDHFCMLTGYSAKECQQKNCRFLQGDETSAESVIQIRRAIATRSPASISLVNYRKDGTPFHNYLLLAPFWARSDDVFFVGCQFALAHMINTDPTSDYFDVSALTQQLGAVEQEARQRQADTLFALIRAEFATISAYAAWE